MKEALVTEKSKLSLDVQRPLRLLKSCPAYVPTPLIEISPLEGVRVLIKDETDRMGLKAFKGLGGVYAVVRFLLDAWLAETGNNVNPDKLFCPELREWCRKFTFVCATAGNHGLAVARGAQIFNARCRVHVAATVPDIFKDRLREAGAEVIISGKTYEQSMAAALSDNSDGKILVSDSSWSGYLELPRLIMEGYSVLAEEILNVFRRTMNWPSHVFVQAGVGGLAAAVTSEIRKKWPHQPRIIIVEPESACCLAESVMKNCLTQVDGVASVMGRLDCKEPSLLAFECLRKSADDFVAVTDAEAHKAQEYLQEEGISTTTSGAAGVAAIIQRERLRLEIAEKSVCLAIVTEGEI